MNVDVKYIKDEGGNIVSPVTNIKSVFTDKDSNSLDLYNLCPDGISHNMIYRGKDITDFYDGNELYNGKTFHACVGDGTFQNIFIGDYIKKTLTIDSTSYTDTMYIADLDTFYSSLNNYSLVKTHHINLWHIISNLTYNMNSTYTTSGGYYGSAMYTYLNDTVLPAITTVLGSSYMLTHQKLLSTDINTSRYNRYGTNSGCSYGWSWKTEQCISLLTENQLGYTAFSSSGYDTGEANKKLSLFNFHNPNYYSNNKWFWLRDVANSASFCIFGGDGCSSSLLASVTSSVFPSTLLI